MSSGGGDRPRDLRGVSGSGRNRKNKYDRRAPIDPEDIPGHISSAPDLGHYTATPGIRAPSFGTTDPQHYHSQLRIPCGASFSAQPRCSSYDQVARLPTEIYPRSSRLSSSSGTPSPTVASPTSGQSPHLSGLRLGDSGTDTSSPLLTQQHVPRSTTASVPSSTTASPPGPEVYDLAPGQRDRIGRVMIEPDRTSWYPSKDAANAVQESVRRLYNTAYTSWSEIPNHIRQAMFNEFKILCTWLPQHNRSIATTFERKAGTRLSSWLREARKKQKCGWIQPHIYEDLCRYWDTDDFKTKSDQAKKARASLKGGNLHTAGAKSVGTISREMEKELGRTPLAHEVFKKTRTRKKEKESDPDVWVEGRAERAYQDFLHHTQELGNDVQLTPEQSTQIWTEKVVGGSHKGRIYGLGSRNNIRRLQSGLQGIGSSSQAEALDQVQLAAMSQQISKLTRALAESEARQAEESRMTSQRFTQMMLQMENINRHAHPSHRSSTRYSQDDDSEDTGDEYIDNSQ